MLNRISQGYSQPPESDMNLLEQRLARYKNREIGFDEAISNPRMARAFLYKYPSDLAAGVAVPFDDKVLTLIWSRLLPRTNTLLATYFTCYKELPSCENLARWLSAHYNAMNIEECPSLERKVKSNSPILFSTHGPREVAKIAAQRGVDVPSIEFELGIPPDGRFHDEVLKWYYVQHAKSITIGDISHCLKEATSRKICAQHFDGQMLGHAIVETLCLRCSDTGTSLPHAWLQLILRVAGDPRVGITSNNYQRWWAIQRADVIGIVKAALAKRDLEYFLQVLDSFADTQGGDIERMYHPRKIFLDGILKAGVVKDAVLILSDDASTYIKRGLPPEERDHFYCSYLTNGITGQCCIYLEIQSGHLIEGTHQSRFRMYSENSKFACNLRDSRPRYISYQDITSSDVSDEFNHHPPISWQQRVMTALFYQYGIQMDPQNALDSSDYHDFIIRHNLPY